MVVRDRVSPGNQGTTARESSVMCPLVVAVSVAVVVAVAMAVAFAVPATATDVDAAEVVDAGGVASVKITKQSKQNYKLTRVKHS